MASSATLPGPSSQPNVSNASRLPESRRKILISSSSGDLDEDKYGPRAEGNKYVTHAGKNENDVRGPFVTTQQSAQPLP
jgi:hypothetical protein